MSELHNISNINDFLLFTNRKSLRDYLINLNIHLLDTEFIYLFKKEHFVSNNLFNLKIKNTTEPKMIIISTNNEKKHYILDINDNINVEIMIEKSNKKNVLIIFEISLIFINNIETFDSVLKNYEMTILCNSLKNELINDKLYDDFYNSKIKIINNSQKKVNKYYMRNINKPIKCLFQYIYND